MVVTVPTTRPGDGPRPVNINKDIPQVVELLQMVFGEKIDMDRQRMANNSSTLMLRFGAGSVRLSPGFVWVHDGRIVGNVTLLPSRMAYRYLIANVAVHPDFRRHGIARQLMDRVMNEIQRRNGSVAMLQVVHNNTPAIRLYEALDFQQIGSMTTWVSAVTRLRDIEPLAWGEPTLTIRPLAGRDWAKAYDFDRATLPVDLNWPEPLPRDAYRNGIMRRIGDFLSGRQMETWVVSDEAGTMQALGSIYSEWGRPHELRLRVTPSDTGAIRRILLAKLVRRMRYLPRRSVRIDHPADDTLVSQLLNEANFRPQRTLTHMRLDLKK